MINWCYRCKGSGKIQDLNAKWWQFWKTMICPVCWGDGYALPPKNYAKTNPVAPPLPQKYYYYCCNCELVLRTSRKGYIMGHCSNCKKWNNLPI